MLPLERDGAAPLLPTGAGVVAGLRAHLDDVFALVVHDERARRVIEIATQKVEYVDELMAVATATWKCAAAMSTGWPPCFEQAQAAGNSAHPHPA